MPDFSIRAVDTIGHHAQIEVEAVICTERQLIQLHKSLYGTSVGIGGVLEGLEDIKIDKEEVKTAETEDVEVGVLQGMAKEAPVVQLVNSIISQAVQEGASDVHISPQKGHVRVRFRVDGKLHTNDAAGAFTRLLDMGIEPFLVSSVAAVSFARRLIRKICPVCREPYHPSEEVVKHWSLEISDSGRLFRGRGCINCMHTGYKGRVGVYEVMLINEKIQDLILRKKTAHEIKQAAIKTGNFKTLEENAIEKVIDGTTTLEEVASVVMNRRE